MEWSISLAIPLLAVLCYSVLLVLVLRHNPRSRLNQVFALYLLSMATWSFGCFMMRAGLPGPRPVFWNRFMIFGLLAVAVLFLQFVRLFLAVRSYRTWVYVGIALYVVLAAANAAGYVTRNVEVSNGVLQYEIGPAVVPVMLYGYLFSGLGMYKLLRAHQQSKDEAYRNRIKYPLAGVVLVSLGLFTDLTPLGRYPIDIAMNVPNAVLIAYAILRYQLLDITLAIRKGLLYSIPTTVIGVGYFLAILAAEKALRTFVGYQVLLVSLFVAAITALAVQPFRDKAQLWVDRLFFREKYDAQLMLQDLSKLAASILDINRLTSLLLDRLTATMHIKGAYVILKEKENPQFHLIARKGQTSLEQEVIFRDDHPLVRWMASHKGPLARHDLDVLPQFKGLWVEEREDLDRIEAELFIPLLVRGELIGMLILGPKLSEAAYSPDERLTLTTLASQTAVAIQNAWLYSDLEANVEELKQMQAQLLQTEKLSALGGMIAGVAHEINNPLTAVIGYSQLLQAMDLGSQVHHDLGQILEAGLRVKRIVANLLDFSRQHAPRKQYLDMNEVVSSALELRVHDLINSGIHVQTDLDTDLPSTMADRHQLQQVLINIINNAQQAMEEKGGPGVLTVTTRRGEDNTILVSIQDTGPGIPPEIMGRIFDPFFTTKEVGKGTGLGLSVSYGIVQEHEGRIWAESPAPSGIDDDGQGATFFIQLPVRESARVDKE